MHKHIPGLCKAVVIDSLVINSSVETYFKASLLCTLLPVMAVQAGMQPRCSILRGKTFAVTAADKQVVGAQLCCLYAATVA